MIAQHNSVQTNNHQVELGEQRHVQQQNNRMSHEIVVVVVHRHPTIGIDRMKIVVGVDAKKHV
jgi:proteasome lid subunit RPN8/RPN11